MWGHLWCRLRILIYCDNLSTVEIINIYLGRSKIPSIMKLMRKLTFHSALHSYVIHAKHIEGVQNNLADAISHFQMTKFRNLAPTADVFPTPSLVPGAIMMV